ncbi:ExbD/TolR family protein [Poriferisphaera sp. WC338]|uniref:ExbD/TolR family protein n=1 Tax=Poriferisphaera sp. WC338 TaxID=3425129 RepID=UPI003D8147E2
MGFASESRERARPVIPLAGMVDVLFLLLIFFMTASVFRDQELVMEIDLPGSGNENLTASADGLQTVVTVSADNRIYLGQRAVSIHELDQIFTTLAKDYPNERVIVRGDQGSTYGTVMHVIDSAQTRGLSNVSQATIKKMSDLE